MIFACDVMLGGLAKWLRVCGIDVYYNNTIDRSGLFRVSREDGRTILTRTRTFAELKEIPEYYIIYSEIVSEQLSEFFNEYPDIDPLAKVFTRCTVCNSPLIQVEKSDVLNTLPALVRERVSKFMQCPSCHKVYWYGTHVARMEKFLKDLKNNL